MNNRNYWEKREEEKQQEESVFEQPYEMQQEPAEVGEEDGTE